MEIFLLYYPLFLSKKLLGTRITQSLINLLAKGEKFYYLEKIYDFDLKKPTNQLVLLLPGKGCEWAKKTGGCTMCALYQKAEQYSKNVSARDLVALYKIASLITEKYKPTRISIFNGGSFLNNNEIPAETQLNIIKLLNKHASINDIFIESRIEYIDLEKVKKLKNLLKNKNLIIGIGLESRNEIVRNIKIKKGLDLNQYEKIIKELKQIDVKVLTYVFIKPIMTTEKEAMADAVETTTYALSAGSDEVAFECAFIQPGTIMEKLYQKGEYRPPWLWSIIEVIEKTHSLGKIRIGRFTDEPPPIDIPHNCPICSKKVEEIIEQYRITNNINLFNNLNCQCKNEWRGELN